MSPERWQQIEALYHAVREGGRTVLEDADPELRREVESLLAQEGSLPALPKADSATFSGQIGPYRLEAKLGEGGMGVVYRAIDTKLNRPVAIKFLSEEFADAAPRRRFQRESQVTSSLNHPHLLTVYDAGEFEGRQYLVTEFIDGGTLRDWAKAQKRTWRQIVELLTGVADGLAAAHQAGVLHRDIKPQNILVATNGYAKLADFGLAKQDEKVSENDLTRTLTEKRTQPGMILGTIAYMSPEQASGKPLDARSDIFSFGVVLYELLADRRPFAGESDLIVLQTIIHGTPPPLGGSIPAPLRAVVEKALAKDPAARYQSMREMVTDLRGLLVSAPTTSQTHRRPAYVATASIALALLLIAGAVRYFLFSKSPVTNPSEYIQITNFPDPAVAPALSPDGRMVAFIRGGTSFLSRGQIYVKLLPDGESVKLTDIPDQKYGPVFTPDGSQVAFSVAKNGSGGKNSSDTWIVPIAGGQPTQFLPNASGLTWMNGRRLLYSEVMSGFHMGIVTSTEDRSDERAIYFPDHERAMAHFSYASPDGKWALVVEMDRTASWLPCRILPLDGSSKGHPVGPSGSCTTAGWSPDGKWMYFSSSTQGGSGPGNVGRVLGTWHLWRQRFPDGAPEQITFGPTEEEGVAVDPDGHSLITSVGVRRSEIWLHNADGEKRLSSEGFAFEPALSADGKRAFYLLRRNSDTELWSIDLSSGKTEHLVPGATIASYEISRDGTEVAYSTGSGEASQIWLAALDRSSPPHQVTTGGGQVSFGAKGDLIFTGLNEKENYLYRIKKDGSAPRERIWSHGILEKDSVSPDGEWVIASAVLNEPGFERGPVAIPVHGGGAIRKICSYKCPSWWSPDGKFFYITTDPTPLIGRTIAIPLAPGKDLPDLPVEGIPSRGDAPKGPDIQTLRSGDLQAGDDPSTYVFTKYDFQGNLFRIPLH